MDTTFAGVPILSYPEGATDVPPPGLYSGVPNCVYHGDSWRHIAGNSLLQKMGRVSPFHARRHMTSRREPTPQMVLGSLVNDFVLYGSEYVAAHYAVRPEFGRSKADLASRADFDSHAAARRMAVVSPDAMQTGVDLANAVMSDHAAMSMLSLPHELTVIWEDESRVICKARPDALGLKPDGTVEICDLKTSADASPSGFGSSAGRFGYCFQFAFYRRGLMALGIPVSSGGWVVVETDGPPYAVATYTLDSDEGVVTHASIKIGEWLELWRRCLASDDYPGYPARAPLMIPAWSLGR